jgi:hypothetical protein
MAEIASFSQQQEQKEYEKILGEMGEKYLCLLRPIGYRPE